MAEAQSNSHTASITPSHTTSLTLRLDHALNLSHSHVSRSLTLRLDHALNLSHSHVSRSLTLHDANRHRRRAPI